MMILDPDAPRLRDGGPRYVETPLDLNNFEGLAEPWNAISAALFVAIALFWLFKLRGHYRQWPFITCCMPLLLTGGIGGTLYHATRAHFLYFLLDILPIYTLGLLASLFLWLRLGPKLKYLLGLIAFLGFLQLLAMWQFSRQNAISASYAELAILILVPLAIVLVRTRFRYAHWIWAALAAFGLALFCRYADDHFEPPPLPMGTHWLWHIFGACTTEALIRYFYRIEQMDLKKKDI